MTIEQLDRISEFLWGVVHFILSPWFLIPAALFDLVCWLIIYKYREPILGFLKGEHHENWTHNRVNSDRAD